jgi:hypothetical protein
MEFPPLYLLDNRSDPDVRTVLDDWYRTRGVPIPPLGVVMYAVELVGDNYDGGDGAAYDAADPSLFEDGIEDGNEPDAVTVGSVDDAMASTSFDDVSGFIDDDISDAGDCDDVLGFNLFQSVDFDMLHDGIYLLRLRGGWYGRGIPVIGWLRRVGGDWWQLLPGARVVARRDDDMTSIAVLAGSGPTSSHVMRDPSTAVEIVNALGILRIFIADEAAWSKDCPRPAGWVERQ